MSDALANIRVLEFGRVVAGPFAASMLGDFGAEVIKLERPKTGDGLRRMGPPGALNLWFAVSGRNKHSVEVDFDTEEGKDYLHDLVRSADVIVENFRPGVMESFGLGWEQIEALNPQMVMLRISGFGQDGPYRERGGFGKVAEAFSGATNVTGYKDGPPVHPGYSLCDLIAGLFGAYGVMVALAERSRSGRGQVVDMGLYEGLLRMIEWQIPFWDVLKMDVERAGAEFPFTGAFFSDICEASDGRYVVVSAATESTIKRVMAFLQAEGALDAAEEAFAEGGIDPIRAAASAAMRKWMSTRTSADAVKQLGAVGVIAGQVNRPSDIAQDPHVQARGSLVEVQTEDYGVVRMPAPVPRLSRTPGRVLSEGPKLGSHNGAIDLSRRPRTPTSESSA